MILEDVLAVQGLAVTRDGIHTVQADAVADAGERVAGEVQVGHRVDDQIALFVAVSADHVVEGDGRSVGQVDFALGDASHGLLHELEIVLDGVEILTDDAGHSLALDAGLLDVLIEELFASTRMSLESLGDELLEVKNLGALLAQNFSETVVLGLSNLQERHVVEQQTLELVRRKVQQFVARTMQANLLKLTDFARYMNTLHVSLLFPLSCRSSQIRQDHHRRTQRKLQAVFLLQ